MTPLNISCERGEHDARYTQTTDHARIETSVLLLRLGLGSMFIARATVTVTA